MLMLQNLASTLSQFFCWLLSRRQSLFRVAAVKPLLAISLLAVVMACESVAINVPDDGDNLDNVDPNKANIVGRVEADPADIDPDNNGSSKFRPQQAQGLVPLAGATIEALLNGQVVASTTADANGAWQIVGVEPGVYVVRAWYKTERWTLAITIGEVVAEPGKVVNMGSLKPVPTGAIRGVVALLDQSNAAGVTISVIAEPYQTQSDGAGVFTLEFLPPGEWDLLFEKSGYRNADLRDIVVTAGNTTELTDTVVLEPNSNTNETSNQAPSLASVSIGTGPYYTNSTITAVPSGWNDPDGDAPGYRYNWFVNGAPVAGQSGPSLSGDHFNKGQSVYVRVTPDDGKTLGTAVNSNTVVIQNSAPFLASAHIPANAYNAISTITAVLGESSDPDDDVLTYIYQWYKNGTPIDGQTGASLQPGHAVRGDQVFVRVTPNDGSTNGTVVISNPVTLVNAPPQIYMFELYPAAPTDDDDLSVVVNVLEHDGDSLSYAYTWYRNGVNQGYPSDQSTVNAALTSLDDIWRVVVVVTESPSGATAVASSERQIEQDGDWQMVAVGLAHSCAIKQNGTLWCWGSNLDNQLGQGGTAPQHSPTQSGTASDWQTLTAGEYHTCAIKTDGRLYCWGSGGYGQLGQGDTSNRANPTQVGSDSTWQQVDAGNNHTCAIKAGQLFCWGANSEGQLGIGNTTNQQAPVQVGSAGDWRQVSAGVQHTCAVKTDGRLYCWGDNFRYQLGDGTGSDRHTPVQIGSDKNWDSVAVGDTHSCALTSERERYCWGSNWYGVFGDGNEYTVKTTPFRMDVWTDWQSLSAYSFYMCGLRSASRAYCWGKGGALGTGSWDKSLLPVQPSQPSGWQSIVVGSDHTCGVRLSGSLKCWGANNEGQLGVGDFANKMAPSEVLAGTWYGVAAGNYHSCALGPGYQVYCWGYNTDGQLGDGSTYNRAEPVTAGIELAQISAGSQHTCGVSGDAKLFCWGRNDSGQLGLGNTVGKLRPTRVGEDSTWQQVEGGALHTCGIRSNQVYCWGYNGDGQLGLGHTLQQTAPQLVTATGILEWQSVSAGYTHTCAVSADHYLYCWGDNSQGQLGDGTTDSRLWPTRVSDSNEWGAVAAGSYFTCAMKLDDTLWCWGTNYRGQVADDSFDTNPRLTPVQIGAGINWLYELATGGAHACALSQENDLYCWGANHLGQVGSGTPPEDQWLPSQTGAGHEWIYVAAGYNHTCAATDIALYCWGSNSLGQLGDGDAWRLNPVLVVSE